MIVRRCLSLACLLLSNALLVIGAPRLLAGEINEVQVTIQMDTPDPDGLHTTNPWHKPAGELVDIEILYGTRVVGTRRVGAEAWPGKPIGEGGVNEKLSDRRSTLHFFGTLMLIANYQTVQRQLDEVLHASPSKAGEQVKVYRELARGLKEHREDLHTQLPSPTPLSAHGDEIKRRLTVAHMEAAVREVRLDEVIEALGERLEQLPEGDEQKLLAQVISDLGTPDFKQVETSLAFVKDQMEVAQLARGGVQNQRFPFYDFAQKAQPVAKVLEEIKTTTNNRDIALLKKLVKDLDKQKMLTDKRVSEDFRWSFERSNLRELVDPDEEPEVYLAIVEEEKAEKKTAEEKHKDDELDRLRKVLHEAATPLRQVFDEYLATHVQVMTAIEECIDVDRRTHLGERIGNQPAEVVKRLAKLNEAIKGLEKIAQQDPENSAGILAIWRAKYPDTRAMGKQWSTESGALSSSRYAHPYVVKLRQPIPEWDADHAHVRVSSPNSKGWRFRVSATASLAKAKPGDKKKEVTSISVQRDDKDWLEITKELEEKKVPKNDDTDKTNALTSTVVRRSGANGVKTYEEVTSIDEKEGEKVITTTTRGYLDSTNVVSLECKQKTIRTEVLTKEPKQFEKPKGKEQENAKQNDPPEERKRVTTTEVSRILEGEHLDGGGPRIIEKDETESITEVKEDGELVSRERTFNSTSSEPWLLVELLPLTDSRTMGGELNYQPPGKASADPYDPGKLHQHSTEHSWTFYRVQ